MATERTVHIVLYTPGEAPDTADALTDMLNDGWRLVTAAPMGGSGGGSGPPQFAAMVILERDDDKPAAGFLGG